MLKKPRKPAVVLLELIREFNEVAGYKIGAQQSMLSIVFLDTSNQHIEKLKIQCHLQRDTNRCPYGIPALTGGVLAN